MHYLPAHSQLVLYVHYVDISCHMLMPVNAELWQSGKKETSQGSLWVGYVTLVLDYSSKGHSNVYSKVASLYFNRV